LQVAVEKRGFSSIYEAMVGQTLSKTFPTSKHFPKFLYYTKVADNNIASSLGFQKDENVPMLATKAINKAKSLVSYFDVVKGDPSKQFHLGEKLKEFASALVQAGSSCAFIHNDLHFNNIMLDFHTDDSGDFDLCVIDFGRSCAITQTGSLLDTGLWVSNKPGKGNAVWCDVATLAFNLIRYGILTCPSWFMVNGDDIIMDTTPTVDISNEILYEAINLLRRYILLILRKDIKYNAERTHATVSIAFIVSKQLIHRNGVFNASVYSQFQDNYKEWATSSGGSKRPKKSGGSGTSTATVQFSTVPSNVMDAAASVPVPEDGVAFTIYVHENKRYVFVLGEKWFLDENKGKYKYSDSSKSKIYLRAKRPELPEIDWLI
jgi:hypothetical protein